MQNYNLIRNTMDISSESAGSIEPATLEEVKSYLKLQGFIDDNDSTPVDDFADDDDLIEELTTTARQLLEQELGISIINKELESIVTNLAGGQQLPYGPVRGITSITDEHGEEIDEDNIKLRGDYLDCPRQCNMKVRYSAGYDAVPIALKTEIKRIVAYLYENRGDVDGLDGYKFSASVYAYSRGSWLV